MRQRLSVTLFISLIAIVVLALAACAPKPALPPSATIPAVATLAPATTLASSPAKTAAEQGWELVVAAARKEGALTLYTTFAPPEARTAVTKLMKDRYGVQMDWIVAPGATNAERIRVEQKAKAFVGDVWWTGFSVLLTQELRAIDALEPFTPPIVLQESDVWKGKGIDSITDKLDVLTTTQRRSVMPIVNTTLLRPEDYPRSYKDLLEPKWKGNVIMHDPAVPGGGSQVFSLVKREYGLQYWEKAKDQFIVTRDYSEVARRVSVGETPIGLGLSISHFISFLTGGAPIRPIPIAEGATITFGPMHLLKHAPHPNAGKVFLNWVLTKEGQEMLSKYTGDEPIRKDVEWKMHPNIEPAIRDMPKWLVGTFDVIDEIDKDVSAGTARKVLGLK